MKRQESQTENCNKQIEEWSQEGLGFMERAEDEVPLRSLFLCAFRATNHTGQKGDEKTANLTEGFSAFAVALHCIENIQGINDINRFTKFLLQNYHKNAQ
ncbi:hypothetical protein ACJX0J_034667 [Zea mays]